VTTRRGGGCEDHHRTVRASRCHCQRSVCWGRRLLTLSASRRRFPGLDDFREGNSQVVQLRRQELSGVSSASPHPLYQHTPMYTNSNGAETKVSTLTAMCHSTNASRTAHATELQSIVVCNRPIVDTDGLVPRASSVSLLSNIARCGETAFSCL
jgi:hypothetical protein